MLSIYFRSLKSSYIRLFFDRNFGGYLRLLASEALSFFNKVLEFFLQAFYFKFWKHVFLQLIALVCTQYNISILEKSKNVCIKMTFFKAPTQLKTFLFTSFLWFFLPGASEIFETLSFWLKNSLEFFWTLSFFGLEFFENGQTKSLA